MMTPDLLKAAGAALFGPRWPAELAAALGISDRTLRRWAAGQADIPAGIAGEIEQLLRQRHKLVGDLLARFEQLHHT